MVSFRRLRKFLEITFKSLVVYWLLSAYPAIAWNALGHRLIAQIAYDQLDAATKKQINYYNHQVNLAYKPALSFVNAAPWLDVMRDTPGIARSSVHYIDIPCSFDGTPTKLTPIPNVVTAIENILIQLRQPRLSAIDKGIHFRELEHLIGDLHQPLHAIDVFSQTHPRGDRGGNLFRIRKTSAGSNLHRYWDCGGGLLLSKKKMTRRMLEQIAKQWEQKWPCQPESNPFAMQQWAEQSHQVAIEAAYTLRESSIPSFAYARQTQVLSAQQIALAGCRLGKIIEMTVVPRDAP